jgi:hypothetical protein
MSTGSDDYSTQAILDRSGSMFVPNTYNLVVPFESSGAGTEVSRKCVRLFIDKKPEALAVLAVWRVNSGERIDAQSWSFDEVLEPVPGGPPSFAARLCFEAEHFKARLLSMDDDVNKLHTRLRELHAQLRELHAQKGRDCDDRVHDTSAKRAALEREAEKLKQRSEELEAQRAPLTHLLRSFVVGGRLYFKIKIDGVESSLFLDVNHRVVAKEQ